MPWVFSQQAPFYDLAYADDTAPVADTAERAEQLFTVVDTATSSLIGRSPLCSNRPPYTKCMQTR